MAAIDEISGVAFLVLTWISGVVRLERAVSGVLEGVPPITGTVSMPSAEGS
jgi:hypothetical protein